MPTRVWFSGRIVPERGFSHHRVALSNATSFDSRVNIKMLSITQSHISVLLELQDDAPDVASLRNYLATDISFMIDIYNYIDATGYTAHIESRN